MTVHVDMLQDLHLTATFDYYYHPCGCVLPKTVTFVYIE